MNQNNLKILPCKKNDNIHFWNWQKMSSVYGIIHSRITTKYHKSVNGNSLSITLV